MDSNRTASGKQLDEAVGPFFAPPVVSSSIAVRLHPMENVTPGIPTLVTFGVPFTRGSLPSPALATVRVLQDGVEVPAYVESLTPWRHVSDPSVDGQYVRVVRIQLEHMFSTRFPGYETLHVEWGQTPRTQHVTSFVDPRTAWHRVESGSFTAAEEVDEPDVYVVLPKEHLAQGALKLTRMLPFDDTVTEVRSDPVSMHDTPLWPGFLEQEHAHKNDFYTVINEDDPRVAAANLCHYRPMVDAEGQPIGADSEPWLYDRPATMFLLYMRSGFLKPLREAVRHVQFYASNLYPEDTRPPRAVGLFKLKNPDPNNWPGGNGAMYSFSESLAYAHWLTGDDAILPHIRLTQIAHESNDEDTRWSPTLVTWTERHTAFRLLSNVVAYEVFGDEAYRDRAMSQSTDFVWHQDGAGGQLPADRVDGGLYHDALQHGDGIGLCASPWMTILTVDAMLRAYAVSERSDITQFLRRVGTFLNAAVKVDADHIYDTNPEPLAYPDYMTNSDGTTSDERSPDGVEHALDVAAGVAWSAYFGQLSGAADASLRQLVQDLYATYDIGVNYWIRPRGPESGRTAFRVQPWRKWAWQHRTTASLSWIAAELGLAPLPLLEESTTRAGDPT